MQNSIYMVVKMCPRGAGYLSNRLQKPDSNKYEKFQWSQKLQTFWTPQMEFLVFEFQEIWDLLNALLKYALSFHNQKNIFVLCFHTSSAPPTHPTLNNVHKKRSLVGAVSPYLGFGWNQLLRMALRKVTAISIFGLPALLTAPCASHSPGSKNYQCTDQTG